MDSSYHHSVSTVVHLDNSHTLDINPTTPFSRFPFFSTCLDASPTLLSLVLSQYVLLAVQIGTSPKGSIIVRYSESDHLLFTCLPPILTTLIFCRLVLLLLILIVLSRPGVSFLLSDQSTCSLYFAYDAELCQLGGQIKFTFQRKILASYFNIPTSYEFYLQAFFSVYGLFEGREIGLQ